MTFRKTLISLLAVLVVFVTVFSLVLPAVALTGDASNNDPGINTNPIDGDTNDTTVKDAEESTNQADVNIDQTLFFSDTHGDTVVFVEAQEDVFPENTTMKIEEIEADDELIASIEASDVINDNQVIEDIKAVDISFFDENDEKVEPEGTVKVSISSKYMEDINSGKAILVHISDDGIISKIDPLEINNEDISSINTAAKEEVDSNDSLGEITNDNTVVFETDGFSTYAVVYTVDFDNLIDGKEYLFSINGGTSIRLSDLLSELGYIGKQDNKTEMLSKIEDVRFSNDNLICITKIEQDSLISDIEDAVYGYDEVFYVSGSSKLSFVDNELIQAGDWLLTSLSPFNSREKLIIYLNDGTTYSIDVTDEQHNPTNGQWALEHSGVTTSFTPTVNSSLTVNEQERNATFTVDLAYTLSSTTLQELQSYLSGYPQLTYDLTTWLQSNPVDLSNTSGKFRDGNVTVGNYQIEDGKVFLTFTNLEWLRQQNTVSGNFKLHFQIDETKLGINDSWNMNLPGTGSTFTIHFKELNFNTNKTIDFDGIRDGYDAYLEKDDDGNYYLLYNASFTTPTELSSLSFYDSFSNNQVLVGNAVVTSPTGQTLIVNKIDTSSGFELSVTTNDNDGKLSSGTYQVTYRTKLTETAVQELENNYSTSDQVTNDSAWKVNGSKDVDGPGTTIQPKKPLPEPEPPLKKVNGVTGDAGLHSYNDELTYTLTYGVSGRSVKDTTIVDTMSCLQNLQGDVIITFGDGTTMNMPIATNGWDSGNGVVWNAENSPTFNGYSTNNATLFSYTFTQDKEGPITIQYKTKILSENDAVSLNLYGTQNINNNFTVGNNSSQTVVHINTQNPTEVVKTVINKDGTSTYKPGDIISYTVEYGTQGQDMSGIILYDSMTDIQKLNGPITITFGDGTSVNLNSTDDDGYIWNDDNNYSTSKVNVLSYTVPEEKTGVITVAYDAKIITKTEANQSGIWDVKSLDNEASTSKGGNDDTHENVDFGRKPEPYITKTAVNSSRSEGENWQPGDIVNWTVTYSVNDNEEMYGMVLEDSILFMQTYNNDAKISINGGTPYSMPTDYIVYDSNRNDYGNKEVPIYRFTVTDSGVKSVVVTYSTTIITGDQALANNISGIKYVYNRGICDSKSVEEGHDTEFPEVPVDKDVTNENETTSIDGGNWTAGQTVEYTLTYGSQGMKMNESWINDSMTDVQTLSGDVTIYYYDSNGVQHNYVMPLASENNNSGVKYHDDSQYSIYNNVELFDYYIPKENEQYGSIFGPLTIKYKAVLINAEKAKNAGVSGSVSVKNSFSTSFGADNTQGSVSYPSLNSAGVIYKTGLVDSNGNPYFGTVTDYSDLPAGISNNISYEDKTVYWTIKVDAAEGSSFPLKDFTVREDYAQYHIGDTYKNAITTGELDYVNAVVKTESGLVLIPGSDYTIVIDNDGKANYHFNEINERIYISIAETINLDIVGSYAFCNQVYLFYPNGQTSATANVEGNNNVISVSKNGTYDPETNLIRWEVVLNSLKKEVSPDWDQVIFKDYLPDGLSVVNYDTKSPSNPSIGVDYQGQLVWGNSTRIIPVVVNNGVIECDITSYGGDNNDNPKQYVVEEFKPYVFEVAKQKALTEGYKYYGTLRVYSASGTVKTIEEIEADQYINKDQAIFYVAEDVTKTNEKVAGLSKQKYTVTYYTSIDQAEWREITNSATGSKTFENNALFTDNSHGSLSASGNETVYVENPVKKTEVQETSPNSGQWFEIEKDSEESKERYYWYQITINPDKEQFNNGESLKLTDRIDTKIDIFPTTIQIMEVKNGGEVNTNNYAESIRPVASYNDDSRMLVVNNLQDSTYYIIRYQVRVRAMYTEDLSQSEYTITNSASLEGASNWSTIITGEHKVKNDGASVSGGLGLIKIDEDDASRTISGAVFELYMLDTGVIVNVDADGNVTSIDTSGILDVPVETKVSDANDTDGDGNPETYTSNYEGIVNFGSHLLPNTLYCWIETQFPTGYLQDTASKHYFVIYYEYETSSGRESAWELDDIWSEKYGFTIASISEGTSWVAHNSKTRSISMTKRWADDYNNVYNTRPDSIRVNLIQIDINGNRRVYDSTVLRPDSSGKWQDYTNYAWTNLPALDSSDNLYTYTIEEENVPGYFAVYSDNQEGITTGSITLTNKLIPSKTEIITEKMWEGDDVSDRPNYITVQLKQILTDSDGNSGAAVNYGDPAKIMRGSDGRWLYTWSDLPTRNNSGGTYTYTVQEVSSVDGYTVSYSDNGNGVLMTSTDTPLTITNTALGSLSVKKIFDGLDYRDLSTNERKLITFDIYDSENQLFASFTLNDLGLSLTKEFTNVPVGTYTIIETVPVGSIPEGYQFISAEYNVNNGVFNVVKSTETEIEVTNKYQEDSGRLKVTKTFSGVDSLPSSFQISNDYDSMIFNVGNAVQGDGSTNNPYVWYLDNVPIGTEVIFTETGCSIDGYSLIIKVDDVCQPAGSTQASSEIVTVEASEVSSVSFVNNYEIVRVNLNIVKVDAKDMETPLIGAKFKIRELDPEGKGEYKQNGYIEESELTDSTGTIIFENLVSGYYEISEIKVPNGYLLTGDETFYIKVNNDIIVLISKDTSKSVDNWSVRSESETLKFNSISKTVTLGNTSGSELPMSGGSGSFTYVLCGIVFMPISVVMMFFKMRHKGRRYN